MLCRLYFSFIDIFNLLKLNKKTHTLLKDRCNIVNIISAAFINIIKLL